MLVQDDNSCDLNNLDPAMKDKSFQLLSTQTADVLIQLQGRQQTEPEGRIIGLVHVTHPNFGLEHGDQCRKCIEMHSAL